MALLAIIHVSHGFNISLDLPNPSVAPSEYGLNAVVSRGSKTVFVTMPGTNDLSIIDSQSRRVLREVAAGPTPTGLALSPDGHEVWVADTDLDPSFPPPSSGYLNEVTVISTTTDKSLGTVDGRDVEVLGIAFAPNGRHAYVSANGGGFAPGVGAGVEVVDTTTLKVDGSLKIPSSQLDIWSPASVAVTPDGKQVWVSSQSAMSPTSAGYVLVFSAGTDEEIGSVDVGEGSFYMSLSPDGRYAYVADKESCDVREIDTRTFQVVAVVRTPEAYGCPYGIAATTTDGVVDTVTGSDHTLSLGKQGDVFERVDLNTSSVSILRDVGNDPLTVTDSSDGLAYVVNADSPFITVIKTSNDSVAARLKLAN